jgi:predicted metal-dependent HD superfamily phosphohydrolase
MFGLLGSIPPPAGPSSDDEATALELAIWYHDREYNPRRSDNEERSARQLDDDVPRLGVSAPAAETARALIRLSRKHEGGQADSVARLFCDLDLAILGASPDAYDAYARGVREEYRHVPGIGWRIGRGRVLRGFLARPILFWVLREREEPARLNLQRELASL